MNCPKCGKQEFIVGEGNIDSETQPGEDITVFFECDDCGENVPIRYTPKEEKKEETSTPKFTVDIIRTVAQFLKIEIEADSEEQAYEKAHEMAGSLDFSGCEKASEYEVEVMS